MKSKINVLIAIYEMIGGIWGIYMLIMHSALKPENSQLLSLLSTIFILTLYALSLIGGFLLCIRKGEGVVISVFAQIFQIPYIITSSCIYCVTSGLQLVAGIEFLSNIVKVTGKFDLGVYFKMYFGNIVTGSFIGINLVPIIIILHIRRVQKIAKSSQLEVKNEVVNVNNDILKSEGE